jgi:hypothetical protein
MIMKSNLFMIQSLLSGIFPDMAIDGIYGKQTEYALTKCPAEMWPFVELYHPSAMDRKENDEDFKMKLNPSTEFTEILRDISLAAKEQKVPLAWMFGFAMIESNFNPRATNGQSRGLFQMQPAAWKDASKYISLPSYDEHWMDPLANARAAAAYLNIAKRSLKRKGISTTDPRYLYMAHQQGVSGFAELLQAYNSGVEPVDPITKDRSLLGNKPPGYKRTTSRGVFLANWFEYLKRYWPSAG